VIFGQAIWFASGRILEYALPVALMFHLLVVLYEEPTLQRKFGDSYERYRRTVPRWIPRPAARRAQAE